MVGARTLWAPGTAIQLGGRRFGLLKALEEAINVFKIRNDVVRPSLTQPLGSPVAGDTDECQSEPSRRSDIPDAVAYRDNAVKIITLVRNARTRNGRADDRFARDAVFGETTRDAPVFDTRDAQLHLGGRLPSTRGDGLRPAAALDELIERLSRARNFGEIRLVNPVMLFEQINQALFDRARFVVARVASEIILKQVLRHARIADVRA